MESRENFAVVDDHDVQSKPPTSCQIYSSSSMAPSMPPERKIYHRTPITMQLLPLTPCPPYLRRISLFDARHCFPPKPCLHEFAKTMVHRCLYGETHLAELKKTCCCVCTARRSHRVLCEHLYHLEDDRIPFLPRQKVYLRSACGRWRAARARCSFAHQCLGHKLARKAYQVVS